MHHQISASIQILENTPKVVRSVLSNIDPKLIHSNEGPDTWSPFDVIGHLIVCEETNFMTRISSVLSAAEPPVFSAIDMTAHSEVGKDTALDNVLAKFKKLRVANLEQLKSTDLSQNDLKKEGIHPKLGRVTVDHILNTWVAHDLTHIGQITRVLAKQYTNKIGPFIEFLSRLN